MFKFLFKRKGAHVEAKVENQRAQFERLTTELNALIALQGEKPKLTMDLETGAVGFDLPEQLADEALALPAPADEVVEDEAASDDAETEADVAEEPQEQESAEKAA